MFIAPGLIVLFVRSLLITGKRPKTTDYVVEYVIISTLYFAIFSPLIEAAIAIEKPTWLRFSLWTALLAIGPGILGLLLGAGTQKGWWRALFGKLGLSVVNSYPTGWDWVFGRLNAPVYVLVTLQDGSRVAGLFGFGSLAASTVEERDIYIDEIYDFSEDKTWTPRSPKQGVLIPYRTIKYVEFFGI